MQLPIDVKKLIDEATNIDEARETPISISLYIDESAPADLIAHVRSAFSSSLPTVRMTVSYLDRNFMPHPGDDMAAIVAGTASTIGAASAALRALGVPVMVVTTCPSAVALTAENNGNAIPAGDVVSPAGNAASTAMDGLSIAQMEAEPIAFDADAAERLNDHMGAWVVSVCREKRLTFAIAFPFMRRPLANDAVLTTSLQNAGVGLVPLIQGADLPVMTLNQAKMVLQIAAAYGRSMGKDRYKELGATVASAFVCRALARELVEFVPVLGVLIRPAIAFGATSALGYAIVEYYEGGENVSGLAAVASSATEVGRKAARIVRGKVDEYAPMLSERIDAVSPVVSEKLESVAPLVDKAVAIALGKDPSPAGADSGANASA